MHYLKSLVPQWTKNAYHLFQAILANLVYGFPSRKLKVIGVTGTNGKTTTVQMIGKILDEAGKKIAIASTINFKIREREWVNKTKYTTLSSFATQKFIKQAVKAGCEYLILETSSHSLDQFRVWGIKYKIAVITNVTREHLDYHKTMEKYGKAKRKLFEIVAKNKGTLIVNLDMEKSEEFLNFKTDNLGYSIESNNLQKINDGLQNIIAKDIELGKQETRFKIKDVNFLLHIPGKYNIENALAAISVAFSEKISLEKSSSALEKIKGVVGRMECISSKKDFDVIIDYAVTPDSLEKMYFIVSNMKKDFNSKIIAVLGSCGERDRGKRPIMGKIVSKVADYIILTNEDPYFEDPWQIINEIAIGVENKEENIDFWKIMDRREAIRKALELAKKGDMVVITGKGSEETMAIGKDRILWNDKQVVLEELKKISEA